MKKQRKRTKRKPVKLDSLKQINLNAAGLDIGSEEIWVCVPEGRDTQSVRVFKTFTPDLYKLAAWLKQCGVDTVAMESTGIYWIPVYEILEAAGFAVNLINARHLKNVSGRKSDCLDCQWIQQLHTYGLLQGSFRPAEDFVALRAYVRHRNNLIRYRSGHIQHMQKALHLMNVQLTNVLSDITGVTGMAIIRAIVAGERDPVTLAKFRNPHCKNSEETLAKSLTGNYRDEHVFALQQALELYDFYNQKIADCDREIEAKYTAFKPRTTDDPPPPAKPRTRHKNDPDFDLRTYLYHLTGVDPSAGSGQALTAVDGLDAVSVQTIISEIGLDMARWRTVKHFTSWLGLAPNNQQSGGKIIKRGTRKTDNRANTALRLAARSLHHSDSALGGFYRRMRARHGAPKANVATAHKLARIIYFMLKEQREYNDPGLEYYEQQYRERAIRNLQRKAAKLGMKVVPNTA